MSKKCVSNKGKKAGVYKKRHPLKGNRVKLCTTVESGGAISAMSQWGSIFCLPYKKHVNQTNQTYLSLRKCTHIVI